MQRYGNPICVYWILAGIVVYKQVTKYSRLKEQMPKSKSHSLEKSILIEH